MAEVGLAVEQGWHLLLALHAYLCISGGGTEQDSHHVGPTYFEFALRHHYQHNKKYNSTTHFNYYN